MNSKRISRKNFWRVPWIVWRISEVDSRAETFGRIQKQTYEWNPEETSVGISKELLGNPGRISADIPERTL